MAAPRKYPDELRERAIRLAVDARRDPASRSGACKRIGQQLGINPDTLRGWVIQAEVDDGARAGTTTSDAQRVAELEREVKGAAPGELDPAERVGFFCGGARPPTAVIVDYIDAHKKQHGVEPICTVLSESGVKIAPSTYYAAKVRPPSRRARQDAVTTEAIQAVHAANYGVYGARKVHAELARTGHVVDRGDGPRPVARCTAERLMRAAGLRGITRAKGPRTTIPGDGPDARPDLVQRSFTATAPDQLWVADITYCRTFAGWVYAAFVVDVFSRRVVGWQLSKSLRTDLALDALEMGIWTRQSRRARRHRPDAPQRQGRPVRRRSLHPAPG